MYSLANKRIVLGVTGGIAAYKSATLTRLLRQAGAEVRVVMTANAREFITPLTLQTLSGRPVHTDLVDAGAEAAMGHIELARWADRIIVAPASANFIARFANGFAADLLSTLCLAANGPVLLAPAMNRQMWRHAAVRENARRLRAMGVGILGPAAGDQACGETGPGRMLEPEALLAAIAESFATRLLNGSRLLVTAGPTREAIDPVRFISNRSSGQMGAALARAAVEAGAEVAVIAGPVSLNMPETVKLTRVNSALEMQAAVLRQIAGVDIFIAAAAVADYRLQSVAGQKIKSQDARLELRLIRNPDILAEVAARSDAPFTVGFAAETEALEANARAKLNHKQLDMIAANRVGAGPTGEGLGFESAHNALTVIWRDGREELAKAPKARLARHLIRLIAARYRAQNGAARH